MAEKMIKIDSAKLKSALKDKKLSLKDVSVELGYQPTYLSASLKNGKISKSAAKVLEIVYNIKSSQYEYVKQTPDISNNRIDKLEKEIETLLLQQQTMLTKINSIQGKLSDISVKLSTLQHTPSSHTPISINRGNVKERV